MTLAVVDEVGDALAAEINAQVTAGAISKPQDFAAVRASVQLSKPESVRDLQVIVVPDEELDNRTVTRGRLRDFWYAYSVYAYARVPDLTNESIDPLKLMVQQIADWFGKSQPLAAYPTATPVDHPNGPLVGPLADQGWLIGYSVFVSLIELTVRVQRQM